MKLALIGHSSFNTAGFLLAAREVWGYSLTEAIDQRQVSRGELEKFLICLASFQARSPQTEISDHLLAFVEVSWLIVAQEDALREALNWLPTTARLVVDTPQRDTVVAVVKTTLADCLRSAMSPEQYADPEVRAFYELLRGELAKHGLAGFLSRIQRLTYAHTHSKN